MLQILPANRVELTLQIKHTCETLSRTQGQANNGKPTNIKKQTNKPFYPKQRWKKLGGSEGSGSLITTQEEAGPFSPVYSHDDV